MPSKQRVVRFFALAVGLPFFIVLIGRAIMFVETISTHWVQDNFMLLYFLFLWVILCWHFSGMVADEVKSDDRRR